MNYQNERKAQNLAKIQPTSVFLQLVSVNLVSFAQQTKEANYFFKKMFLFSEKGNILFTKFLSFSAEIRAGATTSTVSSMTLLLSFVIYNLQ